MDEERSKSNTRPRLVWSELRPLSDEDVALPPEAVAVAVPLAVVGKAAGAEAQVRQIHVRGGGMRGHGEERHGGAGGAGPRVHGACGFLVAQDARICGGRSLPTAMAWAETSLPHAHARHPVPRDDLDTGADTVPQSSFNGTTTQGDAWGNLLQVALTPATVDMARATERSPSAPADRPSPLRRVGHPS